MVVKTNSTDTRTKHVLVTNHLAQFYEFLRTNLGESLLLNFIFNTNKLSLPNFQSPRDLEFEKSSCQQF
jgi:hypothetical protein